MFFEPSLLGRVVIGVYFAPGKIKIQIVTGYADRPAAHVRVKDGVSGFCVVGENIFI